jgi:hypothetical protein
MHHPDVAGVTIAYVNVARALDFPKCLIEIFDHICSLQRGHQRGKIRMYLISSL